MMCRYYTNSITFVQDRNFMFRTVWHASDEVLQRYDPFLQSWFTPR